MIWEGGGEAEGDATANVYRGLKRGDAIVFPSEKRHGRGVIENKYSTDVESRISSSSFARLYEHSP